MEPAALIALLTLAHATPRDEPTLSYFHPAEYERAVAILDRLNLLDGVEVTVHKTSWGEEWETFKVAGVSFDGPRDSAAASKAIERQAAPIEKLGSVLVDVDGITAEITGPVADGLRQAVLGAHDASSRTLAAVETSDVSNVVEFPRGQQDAPEPIA